MDQALEELRQLLRAEGVSDRSSYDIIWKLREFVEAVIAEKTGAV